MVVWLLVELKPNSQYHGKALSMLGAVLGCHETRPKGPKLGYKSYSFGWVRKSETERNESLRILKKLKTTIK